MKKCSEFSRINCFSQNITRQAMTRGFNGSVNIPESCDFQSQFDPLNITF